MTGWWPTPDQHMGQDGLITAGSQDSDVGHGDDRRGDPCRSCQRFAGRRDPDGAAVSGHGPVDDRDVSADVYVWSCSPARRRVVTAAGEGLAGRSRTRSGAVGCRFGLDDL